MRTKLTILAALVSVLLSGCSGMPSIQDGTSQNTFERTGVNTYYTDDEGNHYNHHHWD